MPTIHPVSTPHNHDGVYAPVGSTGGVTVEDEGTPLTARGTINFTGDGVIAADDAVNERTNVTISGGGVTDHGALTGLADDDHTQYVKHSLATAVSDFLVASGAGAFVKKTLAEVKTILGLGSMAYTESTDYLGATATAADSNKLGGMSASMYSVPARVIPFTNDDGYLSSAFIPQAGNANTVDMAHASATPAANTIPIADANGKLANGWNLIGIDGWIPVSATWSYASATTITVPSGAAAIYKVGQGFRLTANGVVKQGYIVGVADTLLTTAGDALTNHTFSAVSYTNTPHTAIGFPVWFAWTPTETGWTDVPTGTYRFSLFGTKLSFLIDISAGTSDATSAVLSLPVAPVRRFNGTNGFAVNGGSNLTVASRYFCETNGLIYFYTDMSAGTWTNNGTKRVRTNGDYEIA